MKNKVIIVFTEINYYRTELTFEMGNNKLGITLRKTSISEIKSKIDAHLSAENIKNSDVEYYCSYVLMNQLKKQTLLNAKTVYDLFCEANIKIKVLGGQQ